MDTRVNVVKEEWLYTGVFMSVVVEEMELGAGRHDLMMVEFLASPCPLQILGLSSQRPFVV